MMRLGAAEIEFAGELTVTRVPGGEVPAAPQETEEYRNMARELGYGADTAMMSREHEITHSLLALWLGLPASPTLTGVANGRSDPHWRYEEAAVLAIQAFARAKGIDLVALAERASRQP